MKQLFFSLSLSLSVIFFIENVKKLKINRLTEYLKMTRLFVVMISLFRYAIGNAERIMLSKNIGWLHTLGNDIDEPYFENKTGGPSIKVNII